MRKARSGVEVGMSSAWLGRSIRSLTLAFALSECAYGIDTPLNLSDTSSSGHTSATVTTGSVGNAGTGGSGGGTRTGAGPGAGPGGGASTTSTGATSTVTTGGAGSTPDGGSGGSATADANIDSSGSGVGGSGGSHDAGVDTRDATTDPRPDVIDAPIETGCGNATQCALKAALVHRYSFNGTGNMVTDSVGNANGTAVNAQLNGSGSLALNGTNAYVDLPSGIIKQLSNATVEMWLTWNGGAPWQRLWDFGNTTGAENTQGTADTTFYVTPGGDSPNPTTLFAAFKTSAQVNTAETRALSAQTLTPGSMVHIAVVLDATNHQVSLYRNGNTDASTTWADSPSSLNDVNNWLGRSQYLEDPNLNATLHEFRIYDTALSAAAVRASFMGGTDPTFLN
jgi:hypothetical protein